MHGPVFLHVITEKGKGYAPAENSKDKFHGVSSFDLKTGAQNKSKDKTYTNVVSDTLLKIAKKDNNLYYINKDTQETIKINSPEISIKDLQHTQEFLYIYDENQVSKFKLTF